jgi:transcriptional regulator with XRE-family HTH domain
MNYSESVRWHLIKKGVCHDYALQCGTHEFINGKAIKRAREQLKVTKVELARKLDVSVKTIDRLENGDGPLTEDKIKDVLDALGISSEEFLRAKKGHKLSPKKRERFVTENAHR